MDASTPVPSQDLDGRTALVTGAASGIGRAVAVRLAAGGAHVIAVDLNREGAESVAAETGGEARTCDLGDMDAVDALGAELGGVDLLVNNAGIQHVAPVQDFPPERYALILRIMLEAPFRLSRAVLAGMIERGWGRLIHVTSVHGLRASPHKAAYISAKHGLEGLSKVIALENGGTGVTSVCISPGFVRTPLVEGQIADQAKATGLPEERVMEEVILKRPAIKELVEPSTVGELAAFLASEHGRMFTGVSLTPDGGWTAS